MGKLKAAAVVAFLLLAAADSRAQGERPGRLSKAEQQILALNREWADAMVRGDTPALERLFDDDLFVTSGTGNTRGKAGELEDTKATPDLKTYFFNTEDLRVRVYGQAAVLTGHAKWRINYKGRDIDNERRFMAVYARRGGRWRMVALQITRLQPRPAQ